MRENAYQKCGAFTSLLQPVRLRSVVVLPSLFGRSNDRKGGRKKENTRGRRGEDSSAPHKAKAEKEERQSLRLLEKFESKKIQEVLCEGRDQIQQKKKRRASSEPQRTLTPAKRPDSDFSAPSLTSRQKCKPERGSSFFSKGIDPL